MGFIKSSILVVLAAVILNKIPGWFQGEVEVPGVVGHVEPGWEQVGEAYRNLFADGDDRGSSLCIYHRGKPVVDLRGGFANEKELWPWQENTITRLFSTTKGLSAIVIGILVDRGLLKYDEFVVKYWPEFGVHGKENITVEMLLSHQTGLLTISDESYSLWDEVYDMEKVGRLLAAEKPRWEIGSAVGYHALTIGMYMDQLVRRVDPKGRSLPQFFEEEIAQPFDVDIQYGVKDADVYRTATMNWFFSYKLKYFFIPDFRAFLSLFFLGNFGSSEPDYMAEIGKTFDIKGIEPFTTRIRPDVNKIQNPSIMATGNAHAVAKLYGILANGGSFGKKTLMSPATIELQTQLIKAGKDKCIKVPVTYGRGYSISKSPKDSVRFGTPGMGGQIGFSDMKYKLGIGFTSNYLAMTGFLGHRFLLLQESIYETVDNLK